MKRSEWGRGYKTIVTATRHCDEGSNPDRQASSPDGVVPRRVETRCIASLLRDGEGRPYPGLRLRPARGYPYWTPSASSGIIPQECKINNL
jgi:hypothetical protein